MTIGPHMQLDIFDCVFLLLDNRTDRLKVGFISNAGWLNLFWTYALVCMDGCTSLYYIYDSTLSLPIFLALSIKCMDRSNFKVFC
jgi:hypothetical protein